MYKLTFKLKQHTPLIHFQHEQAGATLRASELKPKLDKFLINKLELTEIKTNNGKPKEIPKKEYEDWFINKEKLALDYKVRVESNNLIDLKMQEKHIRGKWNTQYPTFFANMGKELKSELVNFSYYDSLGIQIKSFETDLLEKIEASFSDFVFATNFGTRQSKGFGSFFPIPFEKDYEALHNHPYLTLRKDTKVHDIFEVINYYHQRLKSGINYSYQRVDKLSKKPIGERFCHYKEAYIKQYLRDISTNYIWDKKWLKEKFLPSSSDLKEKRFIRAFLGLSYDFKFGTRANPCNKKGVLPDEEIHVRLKTDDEVVQRIKSPILYKPIQLNNEWRIYILIDDQHLQDNKDIIQNRTFTFETEKSTENLKTPDKLIDFNDLIKQYNSHLTSSFKAYNFVGKHHNVNIVNP